MVDIIPKLLKLSNELYFPKYIRFVYPVKDFISNIPENVVIFCREKISYEAVKKLLNRERVFLDH